jgi:putative addiction module CopG family antidote
MKVSLTPELERFVNEKVETGLYQTASEVVREGLRLLKQREEERLQSLRRDVTRWFRVVGPRSIRRARRAIDATVGRRHQGPRPGQAFRQRHISVKRYRLSPEAKHDLDEIFDYVAVHGDIAAADRLIDDITRHFPLLGNNPQMGRSREEIAPGARSFPVGNYVIY